MGHNYKDPKHKDFFLQHFLYCFRNSQTYPNSLLPLSQVCSWPWVVWYGPWSSSWRPRLVWGGSLRSGHVFKEAKQHGGSKSPSTSRGAKDYDHDKKHRTEWLEQDRDPRSDGKGGYRSVCIKCWEMFQNVEVQKSLNVGFFSPERLNVSNENGPFLF